MILRLRIPLRRNRRQYEQLTDFDRGRIIGLREAGWSNRRISRHLGRSDMVVARCWQQWITEGRVYRRGGSGRPRNTNDREDRAIRRVATSAPTTSLASIQRHLLPSRHPVPSRETIRRRLTEVGLRSRRPLRRLPLTPHHRQCRLDFCRPRATWSVTDWRRVIFSDESRFSLSADDHRTRVWRRTGQRSDPAFIVERHTAISQGVTVWGAISWDTRSSLVVLQGTLTARRYVDDILTPIVLPMLSSRPGAIYQQDNARPHTARLSQQCLQGYDVLPWPSRSPDLSPIEHVWTRWEGNCSLSPVCISGQKRAYGVARHEEVNVTCEVDADPDDIQFRWMFNNTSETIDIITFTSSATQSIASYIPRSKMDYGTLSCWGRNSIGVQRHPCVFSIVPAGPPDPLQNCTLLSFSATSFLVNCTPGTDDGGLKPKFHLMAIGLRDDKDTKNFTVVSDEPQFLVRGLNPGMTYELVMYASNAKGRSTTIELLATTLFMAERRTG
ncbi:transposable element Tcb2 transposase [Trichonephila clavipes]|nr:transposable element Tcb2 transposase [Trichonephila clavipes]